MATKGEPKIVRVEWQDARSIYEQLEFETAVERVQLSERVSVGFLVKKTREVLLLCGVYDAPEKVLSRDHTPDVDGGTDFTIIPRGWVKSITHLVPAAEQEKEEA